MENKQMKASSEHLRCKLNSLEFSLSSCHVKQSSKA